MVVRPFVPPPACELIMQKTGMDCVVACLAAVLGLPYVDVAREAIKADRHALRVGLTVREACAIARRLGHGLASLVPPFDVDDSTGVLYVRVGRTGYHAVVLFNGSIYDPADGLIYLPDAYLASKSRKLHRLLVPTGVIA